MELAAQIPHGGVLLHALVAAAIHSIGCSQTERQVSRLPAAAIPPALIRLRRIRQAWPTWAQILEGERTYTLAALTQQSAQFQREIPPVTLWRLWTGSQEEAASLGQNPWSLYGQRLRFWLRHKPSVLDRVNRYYDQEIAESRKPLRQRRPVIAPNDPTLEMLLPIGMDIEPTVWWPVHSSLDLLEVALAVRRHRLERGRYPARLQEISPRWLPTIPRDPWGKPIAYRLRSGKPLIYSFGPNGVDDGGLPLAINRMHGAPKGDLVWGQMYTRR